MLWFGLDLGLVLVMLLVSVLVLLVVSVLVPALTLSCAELALNTSFSSHLGLVLGHVVGLSLCPGLDSVL